MTLKPCTTNNAGKHGKFHLYDADAVVNADSTANTKTLCGKVVADTGLLRSAWRWEVCKLCAPTKGPRAMPDASLPFYVLTR